MKQIFSCMNLDLLILKPYMKSILLVLFVPLLFPFLSGSILEGLSFAVTVAAMTTSYTFAVAEKSNLNQFYGFLPVKKEALVLGRYLTVYLMGFVSLLFSLTAQSIILGLRSAQPALSDSIPAFFLCAALFCIYAGIQLPGYFRFGSIRGRALIFIPTIGFLLFHYVSGFFTEHTINTAANGPGNLALMIGAVVMMAFIICLSYALSVRIVNRNGCFKK